MRLPVLELRAIRGRWAFVCGMERYAGLFCACGAKMTAAVVLIGAICPLPSREFAIDPWDDLDAEIVGIWEP